MNKVSMAAAALALTTLFSTAAMAEDVTLSACTSDGHTATLHVDAEGSVHFLKASSLQGEGELVKIPLATLAQSAFARTAAAMTADELHSQKGLDVFMAKLRNAEAGMHLEKDAAVRPLGLTVIGPTHSCSLRD